MAQYDGSIRINTKISTKDAKVQLSALQHTIVKTADEIASLRSKMDAMKDVKFPTKEFTNLEAELKKAVSEYDKLQEKMAEPGKPTEKYKALQKDLQKAQAELEKLAEQQEEMEEMGFSIPQDFLNNQADASDKVEAIKEKMNALEESGRAFVPKVDAKELDEAKKKVDDLKQKIKDLKESGKDTVLGIDTDEYANLSRQLGYEQKALAKSTLQYMSTGVSSIISKAKSLYGKLAGIAKGAFSKITKSVKQSSNATSTFGSRLKSLALSMLIFNQISKAFNVMISGMKEGFGNLYNEVGGFKRTIDGLKASMLTLKNSFAAAFRPLVEIAIPYIQNAIDALASLMDMIGQFTAAVTGQKTYTKAVRQAAAAWEDAGKAVKGYLSPLDEINKYDTSDSDGSGGGASDQMFEENVPIRSSFLDMYQNIKDLIKNQDWEGLGAYIAEALNKGLQKIYDVINWDNVGPQITYFVTAFTGAFNGLVDNLDWDLLGRTIGTGINTVVNTLNLLITGIDWVNLGNGLANSLNGLANEVDFTSLGMLIGNKFMILPSIALGFVQNLDWSAIGTAIGNALNGIVGSIDLSAIGTMLGTGLTGIFQAAIDFAATFDWKALGTNIFQGINAFFTNTDWAVVGQGISSFALGMLDAIIVAIDGTDWKAVGEGIVTMLKNIDWASLGSKLFEAGLELIKGLLEAFGELPAPVQIAIAAISGFFAAFKATSVISGVVAAIKGIIAILTGGGGLSAALSAIVSFLGGPMTIAIGAIIAIGALLIANWDEIKEAAGKLKDWLVEKWEGVKKKTSEIWNSIGAKLSEAWNGIKNVASTAANAVKNGVTNAWNALKSVTSNIWNGIMNVIKRPINGILGFVESLANGVVNAINTVIRALNRLSFDIPSWVPLIGGNHFGFNIPELSRVSIPRLATGTVVPPNREFMAVLGDNKREPEVVSPLSTMKQAVLEAIAEAGGIGEKEITIKVPVYIGDKQVYEATVKYGKTQQMSTGKNPFLLGTT